MVSDGTWIPSINVYFRRSNCSNVLHVNDVHREDDRTLADLRQSNHELLKRSKGYDVRFPINSGNISSTHLITVLNVVAARLCFHRHLSFCSQWGCLVDTLNRHPLGRHPLGRHTPWADTQWADTPRQNSPRENSPLGRSPPWQTLPLARHPPPGRYSPG